MEFKMSTSKKLTAVLPALCLLFLLTACPTPTVPTPPGNTPEQPAGGTPEAPAPVAPTVIGTYTINNKDASESTVTFYSDNTYTEGEEDYIAAKGTFTGTLADGETITLTPTEVNFSEEEGVDNFMTIEQAQVAASEGAFSAFGDDEDVQFIIAFAFMPQDYTIDGTILINDFGGDFGGGNLGDDDDDSEDDEPVVVATFSESTSSYNIKFEFFSDNTFIQWMRGYPQGGGTYTGSFTAGSEIVLTQTTATLYAMFASSDTNPDDIDFSLLTLEDAVDAVFDESNTKIQPIRDFLKIQLGEDYSEDEANEVGALLYEYFYNSSSGSITLDGDDTTLSFTIHDVTFSQEAN